MRRVPSDGGCGSRARFGFQLLRFELQSCLDNPDGIGGCRCDDTGNGCGAQVHYRRFVAVRKVLANNALAISIGIKVNGACRDHTDEGRPQSFKQSTQTFALRDFTLGQHDSRFHAH